VTDRDRFRTLVADLAAKAKTTLPDSTGRIDSAVKLVLSGDVELLPDGTATVGSSSDASQRYMVNGSCSCRDYEQAPQHHCKHRIARALQLRTERTLRATRDVEASSVPQDATSAAQASTPTPEDDDPAWSSLAPSRNEIPASEPHANAKEAGKGQNGSAETPDTDRGNLTACEGKNGGSASRVPPESVVMIQGKPFIKFSGLLQMAHAQQLVELSETWIYNDADLSLAHAVAIFEDGRRFEGSGDASPSNVNHKIVPHFRRVALTRAKSRPLRDALNIDMVAVEELGEMD
jgi:hypothetical protein